MPNVKTAVITKLGDVLKAPAGSQGYMLCRNPECSTIFHEVTPGSALAFGVLPDFFINLDADELNNSEIVELATLVLAEANSLGIDEVVCQITETKVKQLITDEAFKKAHSVPTEPQSTEAGQTQAVTSTDADDVKWREEEFTLTEERTAVELEHIKAQTRKLNADALLVEYQAAAFKLKHKLG